MEGLAEEMTEHTAVRLAGQLRPRTFQKITLWLYSISNGMSPRGRGREGSYALAMSRAAVVAAPAGFAGTFQPW